MLKKNGIAPFPGDIHSTQTAAPHRFHILANLIHEYNDCDHILGSSHTQEQSYGYQVAEPSSVLHVDMNKPVELVFNVDQGNVSNIEGASSMMLTGM